MALHFLQCNLERIRTAHVLTYAMVKQLTAGVLIVVEPHKAIIIAACWVKDACSDATALELNRVIE